MTTPARCRSWPLLILCVLVSVSVPAPAQQWKTVFDPFTVLTLHITMDPADWDRIRFDIPVEGDPASQEKAEAWFHADGETPILVTVRRKGATDPALPSEANPQKISLKIDINDVVPGQRWHGLRKLSLENGGSNPLGEGFSWQVHRRAVEGGFYRYDAANAAWVRVIVNGDYKGVFTNAEQRDEQFLRNRDLYSPSNTWLYKVDGSDTQEVGVGDSPTQEHLCYAPFTSKPGGGPNNNSCPQPDLDIDLPQWIDMQSMLTLGACNAFVENNDGLITHSGKNSFAADFNPPNQRVRLYFPWDLDAGIKQGVTSIYGSGAYQVELLDHPWFGRVYEHIFQEMLAGPLSESGLHALLDQLEPVLTPALDSDPYGAPSGGAAGAFNSLRNWVTTRTANIATQYVHPFVARPVFNQDGGEVVSGFALTMTAPVGQVYFTTDGTDPRGPGNAIGASAQLSIAPHLIDRTSRIIARTFDGTHWSGLATEATFNIAAYATAMRVTEIMYHPADDDPLDAIGDDAYEFLELHNSGATDLDLSDFFFDGITYTFPPSSVVSAGGYVVLIRDVAAFQARYPGVSYDGIYLGKLSNGGEKIRLRNGGGTTVISVEYDDDPPWVLSPDGLGYSLVNQSPDEDPDEAANWRASRDVHGSPGAPDPSPAYAPGVFISEVLANAASPYEDAVEIEHGGSGIADMSGWFLSDEARDVNGTLDPVLLKKFALPAATSIAPGHHVSLYEQEFNSLNPRVPFALGAHGGRVYLSSADASGNLTGHIVALDFPATDLNTSYGRVSTSVGFENARLAAPSFGVGTPTSIVEFRTGTGAPNGPALVGPVVISEIMYNPSETGSEFVELYNLSGSSVDLSGWDIDGISGFKFPPGTFLPAGGFVLLIDTAKRSPAQFRTDFNVPASVPIFGDLFDLGNAGESLRLEKPNPVPLEPDILVERVRYNDKSPWPTEADGAGPSLERFVLGGYGNEPLNWRAAAFGGSPGAAGTFAAGIAIARESTWDYKTSASTLGTAWQAVDYNATSWPDADGPSGYGETFLNTIVPFGPDPLAKYPTTYFRKPFVINDDPAEITALDLSILYDDGIVVYLNGQEVVRRFLPAGAVDYSTPATADGEATVYEVIDLLAFKTLLEQGTNVLAVEVHQFDPVSADLVWDADLLYATAASGTDSDGDGMPNDWETANELDPEDPTDAPLDADGDGLSNYQEFLAGTDPQDPSSLLRIAQTTEAPGGGVQIEWTSVIGKTYQVTYSPNLVNWFGFGPTGDLTATSPLTRFVDPSGSFPDRRFYRIELLAP